MAFTNPSEVAKLSPLIPPAYISWYGYYLLANTVLMVVIFSMKKLGWYVWFLMAVAAAYLDIQYGHVPQLGAIGVFLTGPILTYILLRLSGSWDTMD